MIMITNKIPTKQLITIPIIAPVLSCASLLELHELEPFPDEE
jgi:hypothetical protein